MGDGCQATDTQWDLHIVVDMHNAMTMDYSRQQTSSVLATQSM
jgi:hypothetical protein